MPHYVEVLADEQQVTSIVFFSRAFVWFNAQGYDCRRVMSDSGAVYVSKEFAKAFITWGLWHTRTMLYMP